VNVKLFKKVIENPFLSAILDFEGQVVEHGDLLSELKRVE